jgi:hypothetical protein
MIISMLTTYEFNCISGHKSEQWGHSAAGTKHSVTGRDLASIIGSRHVLLE